VTDEPRYQLELSRQALWDLKTALSRSIQWCNKEADRASRLDLPAIVETWNQEIARLQNVRDELAKLTEL